MSLTKSECGKIGAEKSRAIMAEAKQIRINEYNKNKKKCNFCEKELEYENKNNKYCNQSCAATANNKKKVKKTRKITSCLFCNSSLIKDAWRPPGKYCTHKCQQDYKKEEAFKKMLSGEQVPLKNEAIRSLLIEKFGARCMGGPTEDTKDCRWDKINPTTGKCPIELEHIDGNSENNVLSNLKLLCPSCHSLTPTYKNLNKGKGRAKRRQRYQEGKSY